MATSRSPFLILLGGALFIVCGVVVGLLAPNPLASGAGGGVDGEGNGASTGAGTDGDVDSEVWAGGAPAPIDLRRAHVDFGIVAPNSTQSKTVTIENTGDHPLEIADVSTSCSCLTVRMRERVIEPGEMLAIMPELLVPDRQDMPMRFSIQLAFKGGYAPATIHVMGTLLKVFKLEPLVNEIGSIEGVTVVSADALPFQVIDTPWFLEVADDQTTPASAVRFDLSLEQAGEVDRFNRDISRLILQHEEYGEIIIDWHDPLTIPGPGQPMMMPEPAKFFTTIEQIERGFTFELLLRGPTPREIDDINATTPAIRGAELTILEREVVPEGVKLTMMLKGNLDQWYGGVAMLRYRDQAGASIEFSALTPETDPRERQRRNAPPKGTPPSPPIIQ